MRDPFSIIKTARITEKANGLTEKRNQYVFQVAGDATKLEIKNAIKHIFKKTPVAVNTINCKGKMKRSRQTRLMVKTPDLKKAIITLKDGESIDLI